MRLKSLFSPSPPIEKAYTSRQQIIRFDELKSIYFPVPKVACTSIKLAVAKKLNVHVPDDGTGLDRFVHRAEFNYISRKDLCRYNSYFKFGFVRNPWDRLISCWSDKIKNDDTFSEGHFERGVHKGFLQYKGFRAGMPFDEFLEVVSRIPDETAERHFRSQHCFFPVKNKRINMDYIGRFETLEADFASAMKEAGKPNIQLPHSNKSKKEKGKNYKKYYSKSMLSLFEKRYQRDIELFGYTF